MTDNKPEKKFRAGAMSVTVWRNETEKNGETVSFPTITFERSYKDKDDKWQSTGSLRTSDLPKATMLLSKAYEYLTLTPEAADL